MQAFVNQSALN